ncbi:MAG: HEPN domain-containing protein [Rhodocyclaceae bacterium]|nr:HEPN domain-containing protein [Rhodocyclaceae bacterium]
MTPQLEEALRLMRLARRDRETFDLLLPIEKASMAAIGFHAQQAVEKALKAVIALRNIETSRTHDLVALAQTIQNDGANLPLTFDELRVINPFAVEFRYDDEIIPAISRTELEARLEKLFGWVESSVMNDGGH